MGDAFDSPVKRVELSQGLHRQRRNVLLSASVIFFYLSLGVELEKVSLLGNTLKVTNPDSAIYAVVLIHIYFLWRYWQYYLVEDGKPSIKSLCFANRHSLEVPFFRRAAENKAKILGYDGTKYIGFPRYSYGVWDLNLNHQVSDSSTTIIPDETQSLLVKKVCFYFHLYSFNEEFDYDSYQPPPGWEKVKVDKKESGVVLKNWFTCNRLVLWWFWLLACCKYVFKQHFFLDYQLPIVISALVITYSTMKLF